MKKIYVKFLTGTLSFLFIQANVKAQICVAPPPPTNTTTASQQVICANRTATLSATSTGTVNWYSSPTSTMSLGTGTTYITPALPAAGTYTYYAQATTCTVSITRTPITVTVNPLPAVAVTSGSMCSGRSFTMTPSGASTYTFSSGSAIITTTLPAGASLAIVSQTVTGANAQGCTNSAVGSVTVYPLPNVSMSAASSNACVNSGSITLTGLPAGGAFSGTHVSANSFTPATIGTFTPVYSYTTSPTGCSNTASTSIVVSSCTGIDVLAKTGSGISIHPNPGSGEFTIEFANSAERHITVMDVTGKLMYTSSGSQGKTSINITSLADGMYYVQIQSGSTIETLKVVKQ